MKGKVFYRKKTWESNYAIGYNEYHFWGFIGHRKGFTKKWLTSIIPFANNYGAWHILGFRFTKTPMYVSKFEPHVNGWYVADKALLRQLRKLK